MMRIIAPLINRGAYTERHERWYLLPLVSGPPDGFLPINAGVAHERVLRAWTRQERASDARARRDAREQFQARLATAVSV